MGSCDLKKINLRLGVLRSKRGRVTGLNVFNDNFNVTENINRDLKNVTIMWRNTVVSGSQATGTEANPEVGLRSDSILAAKATQSILSLLIGCLAP